MKPVIFYSPDTPSLKVQLNNYVLEEIAYEEHLKQLFVSSGTKLEDSLAGFRLKPEISVSQLAYLTKVLVDREYIKNRNNTEVLRFLSRFLLTKKSEHLSYEILRTKFYNLEQNTKNAVRDMLLSMAVYTDKN